MELRMMRNWGVDELIEIMTRKTGFTFIGFGLSTYLMDRTKT